MLKSGPVVSVVIPTYNSRRFLKDALDSVHRQTFRDFEIIVVDDGSTDGTEAWLADQSSEVRYCYQHNQGQAAARNKGVDLATGKYIAFLDADDIWLPGKLLDQYSLVMACPETSFVFTDGYRIELPDSLQSSAIQLNDFPRLSQLYARPPERLDFDFEFRMHSVATSSLFFKRELFQKVGGIPTIERGEDFVLCCLLLLHASAAYIHQPLIGYRVHKQNTSSRIQNRKDAVDRIITKDNARLKVWESARQLGFAPKIAQRYARFPLPVRLLTLLVWRISHGTSREKVVRDIGRYLKG